MLFNFLELPMIKNTLLSHIFLINIFQLIVLVGVRKWMDRFFTSKECSALDDPLPIWRYLKKGNEPPNWRRRRSTRASRASINHINGDNGTAEKATSILLRKVSNAFTKQTAEKPLENEVFQ